MKKIMVMLMMMVLAIFASPLFALDGSTPGVCMQNFTNDGNMNVSKKDAGPVGAAHAESIRKVNILHKDTLMHSWGETGDNKMNFSGYKQDAHKTNITLAVVCQLRGEVGV